VHGGPQAARIIEQQPAQAQQRQHNQQWYATLMDQGASAGDGTQSLLQPKTKRFSFITKMMCASCMLMPNSHDHKDRS